MLTPREIVLALVVGPLGVLVPGAWAVELVERQVEYASGDIDVPALLLVPKAPGPHAAVVFIHGRSGLNDRVQTQARRLAGRGFAVLAPDYHTGRFIPENPIDHDPATEKDVERGLDFLKTVPGVRADKVAVVGLSRGGYHAERLKERGVPVELVVYPGAQRAFDFRRNMRTVGDDLAREDALNRTVRFLNRVLGARGRETE